MPGRVLDVVLEEGDVLPGVVGTQWLKCQSGNAGRKHSIILRSARPNEHPAGFVMTRNTAGVRRLRYWVRQW